MPDKGHQFQDDIELAMMMMMSLGALFDVHNAQAWRYVPYSVKLPIRRKSLFRKSKFLVSLSALGTGTSLYMSCTPNRAQPHCAPFCGYLVSKGAPSAINIIFCEHL